MALPSPERVVKLTGIYLDRYESLARNAPREPMEAAALYDEWFRTTFRQSLESLLVIQGGKWTGAKDASAVIRQAGMLVENGVTQILGDVVAQWITENYPKFWQAGLELWRINKELQGINPPRTVKPTAREADQVQVLAASELATMQDHIARHRRQVERSVGAGIARGWTTDRFIQGMTAPDGHIVGFMYGNSRYSWYEHIRRMIVGRSRMVAQSANEYRHMAELEADNG